MPQIEAQGHTPIDDLRDEPVAQSRVVKRAWGVALIWGCFTVLIAGTEPLWGGSGADALLQATVTYWLGALLIGAALAVKRGARWAGWLLVGYAVLDGLVRILGAASGLLVPIIFLVLVLPGALELYRRPPARAKGDIWERLLYEIAFLMAGQVLVYLGWSFLVNADTLQAVAGFRVGLWGSVDLGILLGLGLAAWKRWAWPGYALVLYQVGNVYFWSLRASSPEDVAVVVGSLIIAVIYGVGASHVHRQRGPLTRSGRLAAGFAVALFVVLISLLTAGRPTRYDLAVRDLQRKMAETPGLLERFAPPGLDAKALGRELALKGARRLPDAQLIERAHLMGLILSALDQHNCAEQLRGRGTVEPALRELDEATLRAWFGLAAVAMRAEHQGSPRIVGNPSNDAIEEAMGAVADTLSPKQAIQFVNIATEGADKATDEDACWYLRTIVNAIPRLDPHQQRTLARLLVAE